MVDAVAGLLCRAVQAEELVGLLEDGRGELVGTPFEGLGLRVAAQAAQLRGERAPGFGKVLGHGRLQHHSVRTVQWVDVLAVGVPASMR